MTAESFSYSFLDTDLHIHRLDIDPAINSAAEEVFQRNRPTAMSAFSLVELKGNYIQALILLHRKVSDSDSFERAVAKVRNTGGRRCFLMLAQLIKQLGGVEYPVNPWPEARRQLVTFLDAQLAVVWEEFQDAIDRVFDDFECTRATESPTDDGERWFATIPRCVPANTRCTIVNYMAKHTAELKRLVEKLNSIDSTMMTDELRRIKKITEETLQKRYPWEGTTCRSVGDLLIGLQSKSGKVLISSNRREHTQMCTPLGYAYQEFPISEIRSK